MKVVIDRIEGDKAVIVLYDDDRLRFNFPAALLPEGSREGSHLKMDLTLDRESTEAESHRIESLLEELTRKKK